MSYIIVLKKLNPMFNKEIGKRQFLTLMVMIAKRKKTLYQQLEYCIFELPLKKLSLLDEYYMRKKLPPLHKKCRYLVFLTYSTNLETQK